uniref:Uncharacterized protein n=1 Tax=Biomphalaria glabrata TaxID=6526 RepID=A0A2C9LAG2_BIOGL
MAASGINEHHEALRKQRFVNRRIYLQKQFLEKLKNNPEEINRYYFEKNADQNANDAHQCSTAACSHELERLQRKYDSARSDEEKANIKKHIDYLTYSAKIKGRYNSTNYAQQW